MNWPLKLGLALQRLSKTPRKKEEIAPPAVATTKTDNSLFVGLKDKNRVTIPVESIVGKHLHCVGATGAGKSAWSIGLINQLLDLGYPVVCIDAKGDLHSMLIDLLVHRLALSGKTNKLPRIIDPFSSDLVAWNLCARDHNVPVELQAYELANLMLQSVQADTGIKQGRLLQYVLILTIEDAEATLLDACRVLIDPLHLNTLISRSSNNRVRHYFQIEFAKESKVTISGIVARLEALLRLPGWRKMFNSPESLDFSKLLEPGVTSICIGNAPLGCRDLQFFAGRLLFLRLARAIMSRPVMNDDLLPVVIFIDEVQEFLSAEVAQEVERLLTLARSRKVSLFLFHQQVSQLEKISASLPKILNTNAALKILFRSSLEDSKSLSHILPITGRILKPNFQPDLPGGYRNPYLTQNEERQRLLETIPRLPSRHFYFWNAEGQHAKLLYSADVPIKDWQQSAANHSNLRKLVLRGSLSAASSRPENEKMMEDSTFQQSEKTEVIKFLPDDFEELG